MNFKIAYVTDDYAIANYSICTTLIEDYLYRVAALLGFLAINLVDYAIVVASARVALPEDGGARFVAGYELRVSVTRLKFFQAAWY